MKTPLLLLLATTLSGASAAAAVNFEKEILPLLEKSCIECHRAPYEEEGKIKEPKAGLRFDARWAILAGSENGKVLEPGKPGESEMHSRTTLPEDDDDFMPPKGEKWTEDEKKLVAAWIREGADFGEWEGNLTGKPEETVKKDEPHVSWTQQHFEKISANLKPADPKAIEQAEKAGARVTPLATGSPLLRVDFLTDRDNSTDDQVAALSAIGSNVAELNLSRTKITDNALKQVGSMPNLVRLDLHQTEIGDAGLKELSELENLIYLNLYGTRTTDAGLKHIARLPNLQSVYLWQSKVTDKGGKDLQKKLPDARVNWD